MKPRHAAALALVGWYLMVPMTGHPRRYNPDAPLSEWLITGAFDTGAECNAAQLQSIAGARGEFADEPFFAIANPEQRKILTQAFKDSQCVASDDPRLKGK
jgi:hypothetical protein